MCRELLRVKWVPVAFLLLSTFTSSLSDDSTHDVHRFKRSFKSSKGVFFDQFTKAGQFRIELTTAETNTEPETEPPTTPPPNTTPPPDTTPPPIATEPAATDEPSDKKRHDGGTTHRAVPNRSNKPKNTGKIFARVETTNAVEIVTEHFETDPETTKNHQPLRVSEETRHSPENKGSLLRNSPSPTQRSSKIQTSTSKRTPGTEESYLLDLGKTRAQDKIPQV